MKKLAALMACSLVFLSCGKPAPEHEKEMPKGEAGVVEITPEAQQRSGIAVTAVAAAPMTRLLRVTGTVQPMDSSIAHLRPLTRGRLIEVLVKAGDRVITGQMLARLDNIEAGDVSAQFNSARAELERLKIQLAAQERQVERSRRLAGIGAAPQKDYEFSLAEQHGFEAGIRAQESIIAGLTARLRRFGVSEMAENSSPATAIRAPRAGVILSMSAAPGEVVEPGAELFALANLSTVYVQAQVYEKDLGQVHVGQTASINVDAYPEENFAGRVVSVSDLMDPRTRTAAVRCQVANPSGRLKLDMFATIGLPASTKRVTLAVPMNAIQTVDGKTVVFVRSSPSRFSILLVETGVTSEGRTEIVRGLSGGELVVSKGSFAVKSVLLGKELGGEE